MGKEELSLNDRKVYNFLYSAVRDLKPMKTRATSFYIAEKTSVSRATVANCLKTLEELGYIRRKTKTVAPPAVEAGGDSQLVQGNLLPLRRLPGVRVNIHRIPKTPAERDSLLRTIADQERELLECPGEVDCAECKRRIPLRRAYRCFYCLLVFCRACGRMHFRTGIQEPESIWELFRAARRLGVLQKP